MRVKVVLKAERVGVYHVDLLQVLTIGLFFAAEIWNEAKQTVNGDCLERLFLGGSDGHVMNQKELVSFLALINVGLGGYILGAEGVFHKATIDDK